MRLSRFILLNLEPILQEWESFARSILPEKALDKLMLRNDAEEILKTIAAEMEKEQSASQQAEKSKGRGRRTEEESAAEQHSEQRFELGFNQAQIVSEFRALRASVIRLWMGSSPEIDDSAVYQLIRFNEGIDQAVAETTERFMEHIEKSRDFATGMLAHDLRNPLNAILTSAECLRRAEAPSLETINAVVPGIIASGTHMRNLINDLLDFTRTRFGQSLPLKREPADLSRICGQVVDGLAPLYPDGKIHFDHSGDLQGHFDSTRIAQLLSNLIANAVQHGAKTTPVTVSARRESNEVIIEVHSYGPPIPRSDIPTIFEFLPNVRREETKPADEVSHLGIGLYITRTIVEAHSGKITVTSDREEGTTFIVRLPVQTSD